jgi:hypothetical protein
VIVGWVHNWPEWIEVAVLRKAVEEDGPSEREMKVVLKYGDLV